MDSFDQPQVVSTEAQNTTPLSTYFLEAATNATALGNTGRAEKYTQLASLKEAEMFRRVNDDEMSRLLAVSALSTKAIALRESGQEDAAHNLDTIMAQIFNQPTTTEPAPPSSIVPNSPPAGSTPIPTA